MAAVFGALIGSFLNVVIYRVPAKKSIVSPPSACGSCGARIRPWDNIPVLSWFVLRGRCRDCGAAISWRYPAVEFGTAVFFAGVVWWVISGSAVEGSSSSGVVSTSSTSEILGLGLMAVSFLYLTSISVALAMIDIDTHTLPNVIVLPAYIVGGVLLAASALALGEPQRLLGALIGGAALFALYLLLALIYPGGMGLGDVKLAGVLGLYLGWLGWGELFVGAFGAFLLGGLFGVILLAFRKAGRKSSIPFGPWMLAGAWVGIFAGDVLASGYLGLFGLI
ncbi:prepilin peptidase [Cryobacterium melibiosiphilum]|nr:prepilin peptidase [Cryobacterium melibiosiphilum]